MRGRGPALIVAVILIAFAAVVMTSTLSAGDETPTHTMPDGATMQGDHMP